MQYLIPKKTDIDYLYIIIIYIRRDEQKMQMMISDHRDLWTNANIIQYFS